MHVDGSRPLRTGHRGVKRTKGMKFWPHVFVGISLGAALVFVSGCATAQRHNASGSSYDERFLSWMSDHLMHDLRLLNACKGKKLRRELTAFCNRALEDQAKEQERLASIFSARFKRKVNRDPFPLWIESQKGEVFESAFLKSMLEGHGEAVSRAKECSARAQQEELRNMCVELAADRAKEISQLKVWDCNWFGHC